MKIQSGGRSVCGVRHPETNVRCTKRPGHYPRTKHSNEKPGYPVEWVSETEPEGEASA